MRTGTTLSGASSSAGGDAGSTKPDAGPCSSQVVTCHDLLLLGGPARAEEKYPFETEPIVMHCGAVPFISKNCKQEGGGRQKLGFWRPAPVGAKQLALSTR